MKYLKAIAMIIGYSAITNIAVADLQTSRAVVNDPTQQIAATANFPTPVSGDLYIATQVGGQNFFLKEGGQFTPNVTPFSQTTQHSGQIPLFNITAKGSAPGRYPLFQVVTKPGTDPLNFNNWVGGIGGLSIINFMIGLPTTESGDFDNNGFADDDLNKDGYHDDDLNKDGYHDDDKNRNGIHDSLENKAPTPVVTPTPVVAPTPVVTPSPVVVPVTNIIAEGQAAYGSCASSGCHGANPAFGQNRILLGRNPNRIINAIRGNFGGMSFLSAVITADSANKISAYLNSI